MDRGGTTEGNGDGSLLNKYVSTISNIGLLPLVVLRPSHIAASDANQCGGTLGYHTSLLRHSTTHQVPVQHVQLAKTDTDG